MATGFKMSFTYSKYWTNLILQRCYVLSFGSHFDFVCTVGVLLFSSILSFPSLIEDAVISLAPMGRIWQFRHCSVLFVSPWTDKQGKNRITEIKFSFSLIWCVKRCWGGALLVSWCIFVGRMTMFAWVCHGQVWRGIKGWYKNKSEDCTRGVGWWETVLEGLRCITGRRCFMQRGWGLYLLQKNPVPCRAIQGSLSHQCLSSCTFLLPKSLGDASSNQGKQWIEKKEGRKERDTLL